MDTKEKDRLNEQRQRVKKAKELEKQVLAQSKKIRVKFMSMEPAADGARPDLAFSFRSIKNYHLVHDRVYDLPEVVVEWLETRQTPVYQQYDPKEESMGVRSEPVDANTRITGHAARFHLQRMTSAPGVRVSDGAAPEKRKAA